MRPDVDGIERPEPGGKRLAREARTERPRKHVGEYGEDGCAPHGSAMCTVLPDCGTSRHTARASESGLSFGRAAVLSWIFLWWRNHDTSARDVDFRYERIGKREHDRVAAGGRPQLQDIAGAEIMDRHHGADRDAGRGHGGEPDQVGVVELVVGGRWQALAR